ncbi:MAG: cadmium-translocating P-type ATPase [Taibaiella sp.]|nr:cadmium-translocating P-type ATPase [Taibaiella sp.]
MSEIKNDSDTAANECCSTHIAQTDKTVKDKPKSGFFSRYGPASVSFLLLMTGLLFDFFSKPVFFTEWLRAIWYIVAYIPVGLPVLSKALKLIGKGEIFTEFLLMSIATLGAFAIKEFPEGVAVMLFYSVGELFQEMAVNRAKRNIKALLDVRPDTATVSRNGTFAQISPDTVQIGEKIQVKPGEKVPLDGMLVSEASSFNTSALTGESRPKTYRKGETVLAGMINIDKVVDIEVSKKFSDSSISRILYLVEHASGRKAPTELFIRKFARFYTPIVVLLALFLTFLPYFFKENYVFSEWLYRALIFLVISCPCALVVSIPLGYFGGIGAASRNGILFKGSSYLDLMTEINTVVMDKTGTLTKGVFKVQSITTNIIGEDELTGVAAAIETKSTHPTATAVRDYADSKNVSYKSRNVTHVEEIAGHGLKGVVDGRDVLVGNLKLLKKFNIEFDKSVEDITETVVLVSIDKKYAGFFTIADEIKDDAKEAISSLRNLGIEYTIMLSGDKSAVAEKVAKDIGIAHAFGDLLPEQKVEKVEEIIREKGRKVAFVGDGINDAPVLALSHVGIAMGGLGSDAAIETADVIIQTDQPSKIATAIKIGKATKKVVWQNIALAFGVKAIVMILGAWGIATMWEAVFADVGVAFLAILNAIRIQRMAFK